MDEEKDMADHIIAAVKCAVKDGRSKEQFQNAASVFWDSWHKAQEFMTTTVEETS